MSEATNAPDSVELRLPASTRHLRLARLTAAGFASDLDFDLETIEDLRLAVDEACALLIEQAPDDAQLVLRYQVDDGAMVIEGRCASRTVTAIVPDAVTSAVLRTTVDAFDLARAGDDNEFRLRKRLEPAAT